GGASPTPTATPAMCTWGAGTAMPSVGVREVGVYFPTNGKFYAMGGRSADTAGSEFTHPFEYDPAANTWTIKAATYPDNLVNNMLYRLGGFDTATGGGQGINQIWEFTPSPAAWVQKPTVLPVPLGYIPTTTIGSLIYTGGGSDITAGALTDTTNSFVYNPAANTIGTIATIPRATGETRELNFNGRMVVLHLSRTATNPSHEVDVYNPVS